MFIPQVPRAALTQKDIDKAMKELRKMQASGFAAKELFWYVMAHLVPILLAWGIAC